VVGGLAVVAHGYGRQTGDLDLVVPLDPATVRSTFAAFAALGYRPAVPVDVEAFADPQRRERLRSEKGMQVLHFRSDAHPQTPIDLFAFEPFDFQREHAAALVAEIAAGTTLRVLRLPALIRLKSAAGRPQDLADIAELRAIHGAAADG
jgi:hypothetical protein